VLYLVFLLLAAYLTVLLIFRLFESRLVFFPNHSPRLEGDWRPRGLPVQEVRLTTADGVKLHAWWIPAKDAKFTFLAFHGNAGNITHRAEAHGFLHQLPVNVLAVEYRGYGRSEGTPSEEGLYRDARAAYDFLVNGKEIPPARIIPFGQSLGTAVAVNLASERNVGGVVLEAPFPSARALARRVYPYLPGLGWIAKSKFDSGAKLERVQVPVLIVHCTQDPVIAFELGEETFRHTREPKSLLRIEGVCHEEASVAAPAMYRTHLLAFLNQIPGQN